MAVYDTRLGAHKNKKSGDKEGRGPGARGTSPQIFSFIVYDTCLLPCIQLVIVKTEEKKIAYKSRQNYPRLFRPLFAFLFHYFSSPTKFHFLFSRHPPPPPSHPL